MTRHGSWNTTNTHNGVSDEPAKLPCKASCCKTPYGHSTARDGLPAWHRDACHCHDVTPVDPMRAIFAEAAALGGTDEQ